MKKIKIIWNKPTAHSRFWSLILFLGILPSAAFYTGIRVQALKREQEIIQKSSYQILFQSERGICRVSDCTIQGGGAVKASSTTSMPVINIISPRQGERLTQKSSVKVTWNTSSDFPTTNVNVLLLDSNGKAASGVVTVPASSGFATVIRSTKASNMPYSILIQGLSKSKSDGNEPFAYSGEFFL